MANAERQSRTTVARPQTNPLVWHTQTPGLDLATEMRTALTPITLQVERELRQARFLQVMNDARLGILTVGEPLQPIHRDPDVWELRWRFADVTYRLYFAEPPILPEHLVALHFHAKEVSGLSSDEITELQNQEISVALLRYLGGSNINWGV